MDNKTLRKLQLTELEILNEVVRICDKFNLKYWLVGGTLLGAVRHKGFIPWDDDIDIAMPRSDYEKFIKISPLELNEKFFLHELTNDKKYYLNFAKIKKKNTFFDEKLIENIDTEKNIFIDIFPYDMVKNPNSKLFIIKNYIYKNLTQIIFYKRGILTKDEIRRKELRFLPFSYRFLLKFQKFISRNKNKKYNYLHSYSGSYSFKKEVMPIDKIFPLSKVEFEGKIYFAPRDTNYYLESLYGDYMKLPPKKNRVAHMPKKIIFNVEKGE